MRIRTTVRIVAVLSATMAMIALGGAAHAGIEGGCSGTVTIAGETYTENNDSASNPIVIPDEAGLTASWTGTTGSSVITDFTGELGVVIGPATIVIADWAGPNDAETSDAAGTYAIDDARDELPVDLVGLYEVSGFHRGAGGSCEGNVMVRLEGNPLGNPVGAGSTAGAVLALVGVLAAGRAKA